MRSWPQLLRDYRNMGGVLHFEWFEQLSDNPASILNALEQALARQGSPVAREALALLPKRRLTPQQFLGTSSDTPGGELLRHGTLTTQAGRVTTDPPFRSLWRDAREPRSFFAPERNGTFASAFSDPPYGLPVSYDSFASLYQEVTEALLAGGPTIEIDEYGGEGSDERLLRVSPYFEAGAEWWGTYLWTIHDWQTHRLCVILGSSTD